MKPAKDKFSGKKCILIIYFFLSVLPVSAALPRVIILSDISPAEKEPDDMESMVRLMLYSNQLDIEGLIATSSCWRQNDQIRPDLIEKIVDAYGTVRENLLLHAKGYPEAESLKKVIREGNGNGMTAVGSGKTTEGSKCIVDAAEKKDSRPVWICVWGGAATLAQALYDIKNSRTTGETDSLVKKLRVYDLSGQDDAGAWICHTFPDIFYIRSRVQWRGFSYRLDNQWHDSRGGDESLVAPEWFSQNVINGHSSLGNCYPQAKYLYEGDTPTFLNLIDNGLCSDPDSIHFGGWGGRFGNEKVKNVQTGSENTTVKETGYQDYDMFTDAEDEWAYNGTSYNNVYCAVFRWRTAYQNDFAARMDWCVSTYEKANHPPCPVVNGDTGSECIYLNVIPGDSIALDASMSSDPEGDNLFYKWWVYEEAGTYSGEVALMNASSEKVTVPIPDDCLGKSIHVILSLNDDGSPSLYRYRRICLIGDNKSNAGKGNEWSFNDKEVAGLQHQNGSTRLRQYTLDGKVIRNGVLSGAGGFYYCNGEVNGAIGMHQLKSGKHVKLTGFSGR